MPLANNDIHVTAIRRSYAKDNRGETVPAYEIHFSIRGQGDYTASLPIKDFNTQRTMEAIAAVATPIIEILEMFPGK